MRLNNKVVVVFELTRLSIFINAGWLAIQFMADRIITSTELVLIVFAWSLAVESA